MIEPIKLMVAGTGNPHVPHYLNGTGRDVRLARFVAVSDEDPGRLEQARRLCAQRPGMTFHADYREMFDAHPDADAVMIGTTGRSSRRYVTRSLRCRSRWRSLPA